MWLNCIWGGVGVGLINLLIYLIVGVFLAGLMVGRTPEYLGKKVEAREMKLAALALLDPSADDLSSHGPVCRHGLGHEGDEQSRGARVFRSPLRVQFGLGQQRLGLRGLGDTWGFNNPMTTRRRPPPTAVTGTSRADW